MAIDYTPQLPPGDVPMIGTRPPPAAPRRRDRSAPDGRRGLGYQPCLYDYEDDFGADGPAVEGDLLDTFADDDAAVT